MYRGSPTSTVSTSTNSSCTHFEKTLIKFNLYDFESKSPTCTISTNTNCHQSPLLVLYCLHTFFSKNQPTYSLCIFFQIRSNAVIFCSLFATIEIDVAGSNAKSSAGILILSIQNYHGKKEFVEVRDFDDNSC